MIERVLFLAPEASLTVEQSGGAGTHMRATIRSLTERYDLAVFIGGDVLRAPETGTLLNASLSWSRVVKSRMPGWTRRVKLDLDRLRMNRKVFMAAIAAHDSHPPDVIYERSGYGYNVGRRLSARWDVPLVLETDVLLMELVRDRTSWLFSRHIFRRREALKFKHASVVTVQSAASVHLARRIWPIQLGTPVFDKRLGVWPGELTSHTPPSEPGATPIVGYVGIFQGYHRMDLLIEAASLARRPLRFEVFGDGKEADRLETISKQENSNLRYHGLVPYRDIDRAYGTFDVAIIPGCAEHMYPVKFLEAAARGIPTIIPRYSVFRPFFKSDSDFVLMSFKPGEASELASCLDNIAGHLDQLRAIAAEMRELIVAEYSWERCGQEVIRAIEATNPPGALT